MLKKVLIIILILLLLILGGMLGYIWYQSSHVFVEDAVYAKSSEMLDLRDQNISEEHYLSLRSQLPDCEIYWDVPFQGGKKSNDTTALTISNLTEQDIIMLKYFPQLRSVDAMGCSDYAQLEALKKQYPDLAVSYQVSLGAKSFDPAVTELTLENGDYDFDILMGNLVHLPQLTSLLLPKTDLSFEQMDAISMEHSGIALDYTVEVLGQEYPSDTASLDLSAMTGDQVEEVAASISMLANLAEIQIMDASGKSNLSLEEVKALKTAAPTVQIPYTFDFFGVKISTSDEEVVIKNKKIGDANEAQVRLALDVLDNCKRFVLDNCKLSNETMAKIREDYRDKTKVVWRVWFGKVGATLTDAEILRAVYDLQDDNCSALYYCEDVRFIDIGHSDFLDYIDFMAGMTKLEAAIISGAPIKSLEPLANCTELKFLELANCIYFTDLTPLTNCTQLEMLNLSYAKIEDLSALDALPLTHFTYIRNKTSAEEEARFIKQHPDCWTVVENGDQPYGIGWRYDEDGLTFLPWYAKLVEVFHYPNAYNNIGWYLD